MTRVSLFYLGSDERKKIRGSKARTRGSAIEERRVFRLREFQGEGALDVIGMGVQVRLASGREGKSTGKNSSIGLPEGSNAKRLEFKGERRKKEERKL